MWVITQKCEKVSWGDKLKVGSEFGYNSKVNLLSGLYSTANSYYNGKVVKTGDVLKVEKQMVFACDYSWIGGSNEPKCILSPSRLRIPNSSYKILGYIPDISGHGNHGKINNSAYAGMSGANGYLVDFNSWVKTENATLTDNKIAVIKDKITYQWISYATNGSIVPTFKVNISGIPNGGRLDLFDNNGTIQTLTNGVNDIEGFTANGATGFLIYSGLELNWSNLVIQQIGKYEGAYCLDGVDDFITIPTTVGGKQVLMKVNWQSNIGDGVLYDQRSNVYNYEFAIYNSNTDNYLENPHAYSSRNNGRTYIDGILNTYIKSAELQNVIHNITATNELSSGLIPTSPIIGSVITHNMSFTKMALYDFMLFDNISTDDKIKQLNTYIGITPKVTLPNYYWDNYGKKNTDANRSYIDEQVSLQKTGTSVNPLENFNISYEGMSGYNGYPVVFGASKTWESLSGVYGYTSDVTNTTIHVTHAEHAGNGLLFSYVKKDGALVNIKEIPAFRVTIEGLEGNSKFGYRYLATEDATEETLVYLGNGTHELAKSFAPTEVLLDLTRNVWVGIFITPMIEGEVVFDCDITIEVLPEYENGLAYDGVSDFSHNTEIEVVEDFTFLVKALLLKGFTGSGGCIARKGDKKHYDTGGYAFIYCFDSPIESYRNSYYSFGKSFVPSKEIVAPPLIGYMTKTNVNGETTTFGTNSDIKGIIFGNWSSGYMNMVIYKSIFYTKTISLLEINFLKNLMEKDEIIDINHPIFISNTEDESNTSQDT